VFSDLYPYNVKWVFISQQHSIGRYAPYIVMLSPAPGHYRSSAGSIRWLLLTELTLGLLQRTTLYHPGPHTHRRAAIMKCYCSSNHSIRLPSCWLHRAVVWAYCNGVQGWITTRGWITVCRECTSLFAQHSEHDSSRVSPIWGGG